MKKITPNWYVITGGPSSGKTTVINELVRLGYLAAPDVARDYISQEIANGRSLKEIRGNEAEFQRKVLKMKIEREKKIPKNKIVFLDNAVPCSIAYYQICGLNPQEVIKVCEKGRYKKIFFLEQLSFEKDYARSENIEIVNNLNRLLKESYENLGYKVINIPVTPIKNRIQRILTKINKN